MSRPAWSYTALNDFVNCPRQYNLKKTKELPFVETDQIRWGKVVHKAMEDRLKSGRQLPVELTPLEPLMQRIDAAEGIKEAETKYTINEEFKPVTWFSKDAWVRGQTDVSIEKPDEIWVGDYKTGKRRPDSDQLMLFGALVLHHKPHINVVKTSFIWTKDKALDSETYVRDQLPTIWKHFMPKVARLEQAFDKNQWPPRPSGLCGWCDATKAQCEFSKKEPK